jgi:heme/copper-type cytochrome/quinol oxidase subunit 3
LEFSPYPEWLNIVAAASPLAFLVLSLSTYLKLGFTRKTDNQFAEPDRARHIGMILLIIAQIGGFGLLFAGFIYTAATGSLG